MLVRKPAKAILLCRMAAWVFAISVCFRFMSLPGVLKTVSPQIVDSPSGTDQSSIQFQLGAAIDLLLGLKFLALEPVCWKRAIVLHRFLGLRGIRSRVIFGVRKDSDGMFAGHAWLEHEGKPLLETSDPDYTVTYSFP